MNKVKTIERVAEKVKKDLENEGSGHDWWHVYRVWNMAKGIAKEESTDMFVVELATLPHNIEDWKFHNSDESIGARVARRLLAE